MKKQKILMWVLMIIGAYLFSGCYTQIKLEDDDYGYKQERKRVIIEKRIEKDGEEEIVSIDTTYESTDERVYEEEERYYYPRHRRAYKFYHPGITIVVGGTVYYDPWYFDYFYYPYVVCRTYYLPWWYGYYSCYRVWYGFVYYDPFYNPFYAPPYWWYDPYWYGGYYPPIIQYRKNDYTRLRDQDGGRRGAITTGNWGRDLNLQVASERSRLRDGGRSLETDRTSRPSLDRERSSNQRDEIRTPTLRDRTGTRDRETPTLRDRSGTRDRDANVRSPERSSDRRDESINRDRRDERRQPTPTERKTPERTRDTGRDRNSDKFRETPDRKETTTKRQLDTSIPNLEQKIIIEREIETTPRREQSPERVRIYREERPRIEYEIPRREYQPNYNNQPSRSSNNQLNTGNNQNSNQNFERRRTETPRYESPRYETPRYETPRYETPRYEAPSRSSSQSYSPPPRTSTPPQTPAPLNDRRRDQ